MIDLKDLRSRAAAYQEACTNKGIDFDVQAFLQLDEDYRGLKTEVEALRSQQNKASRELPKLSGDEKAVKLEEMKEFSAKLKSESQRLKELEEKWKADQLYIPSVPLRVCRTI